MLFYWRYLLFIQFRFIEKYKKPKTLQLQYFFNFVFTYLSTSLFLVLIYISTLEILPSSEGFLFNYTYL